MEKALESLAWLEKGGLGQAYNWEALLREGNESQIHGNSVMEQPEGQRQQMGASCQSEVTRTVAKDPQDSLIRRTQVA